MTLSPKTLGGIQYNVRQPPALTWGKAITASASITLAAPVIFIMSLLKVYVLPSSLSKRLDAFMIPRAMQGVEEEFRDDRWALLSKMQGRVLDVGSGGGAYIRLCQRIQEQEDSNRREGGITEIVAVEPLLELHDVIREQAQPTLSQFLTIFPSLMDIPKDKRFDWIILGNVLCEVEDPIQTLRCIDEYLEDDSGTVYFSERIGSEKGSVSRFVQDWILHRMWRGLSGGCHCNRDTVSHIQTANPNWEVIFWKFPHFHLFFGPWALGLARKKKPGP